MFDYQIICENSANALSSIISKKLKEGYTCVGGVCVVGDLGGFKFYQAIAHPYRYHKPNEPLTKNLTNNNNNDKVAEMKV